jgi:hypothetical protein
LIFFPVLALAQLPIVNLTLGDGNASEAGPDPGSFVHTRTGSTTEALLLDVDVQGTATFNADYSTNPAMVRLGGTVYRVTIPPDQLTATATITPVMDGINEGDETVNFTLMDDNLTYTVGEPANATINIADFVEGIFKDSFEDLEN